MKKYRNTKVYEQGSLILVKLYETVICELGFRRSHMVLNSGGHRTATTKKRMNEFLDSHGFKWKVCQENFEWVLWNFETEETREFFDGMIV